jgi:hypothetical protein
VALHQLPAFQDEDVTSAAQFFHRVSASRASWRELNCRDLVGRNCARLAIHPHREPAGPVIQQLAGHSITRAKYHSRVFLRRDGGCQARDGDAGGEQSFLQHDPSSRF